MYKIYKIQNEKTLLDIANKFDISVVQLKTINGIDDNYKVQEGNFIIVPKLENDNFITYKVKSGDSIYKIAESINVPYEQLLELNGLGKDEYIYIDQEILIPNKDVKFKIIEIDETLTKVADDLAAPIQEIIKQNDNIILNPNQLIVYRRPN